MGRHRDVILLVGGGRDRVDARRMRHLLVLGHERRGRHLRDHEAGVEAGFRGEEGRQPGQGGIDQHGDPTLGERADLAQGQGDHVGGEGHRLGMEVAARDHLARVGEDERVVGDAVRLRRQRRRGLAQEVEAGAHHLRLAAQAIGVLDALVVHAMRSPDGAARHERPERRGGLDLARMPPQALDALVEGPVRAPRRIGGERARDEGRLPGALGLEQGGERQRRRDLGAVEEGEALLRAERQRPRARWRRGPRPPADGARRRRPPPRPSGRPRGGPTARGRRRRRPSPAPG